jgi:hypothetical protein
MPTYNKKIPQLPLNNNPNSTGFTIYDDTVTTYSIRITELQDVKHWISNENKILGPNKTLVISGDYVLENSRLTLESTTVNYSIGELNFKKESQIFIGGNLLLMNSHIINNGKISVAGEVILSGTSTITGTGIII